MQMKKHKLTRYMTSVGILLLVLFFIVQLTASTAAALPPRPTPEPAKKVAADPGGYIKLQVEDAPADMWTVVQWVDAFGNWHDVTGWQGTLDDGATKLWWVAPDDFAKGPFRWVAYDAPEGYLLGGSAEFNLPDSAKQVVLVELILD